MIDELVDEHLALSNIFWLPDVIEKPFIRNLYAMVPALIDNILLESEIRVLGTRIEDTFYPRALE